MSDLKPPLLFSFPSFLPFVLQDGFRTWQHRVGEAMETQVRDSQLYSQGEFLFPREGSNVSREAAGELLHRIIQPNYTHWVNIACNQTEGPRISL